MAKAGSIRMITKIAKTIVVSGFHTPEAAKNYSELIRKVFSDKEKADARVHTEKKVVK